jgi:gamma-glutamylcyclotransferase (GGCT)/AIG2-like uncharacterized protein YtfP
LEYVGQAKIGAAMYDLGRYPGAVKDRTGKEVVGDVFLVNYPERVLRILDHYVGIKAGREGEFVRERGRVRLRGGKNLNAWVYWYNYDPAGKKRIRYKEYLNYLKNKSIH